MKKIPTLFEREYADHKVVGIKHVLSDPSLEWVINGEGRATLKIDGACCAITDGKFYRRYDAKHGKKPPEGAIPCCEPDPITGHWPHWLPVTTNDSGAKWYIEAFNNTEAAEGRKLENGTYEAIGPHFQGNPYNMEKDVLVRHGLVDLEHKSTLEGLPDYLKNITKGIAFFFDKIRTFEWLRDYLKENAIEGIVFWKDGEPKCKIKRSDFGFPWPVKEEE